MAKSARVIELEEAIVQAVATLDEADGSRIGALEASDSAREILKETYGLEFENDVSEYLSSESEDDDSDEFDEDDEDE